MGFCAHEHFGSNFGEDFWTSPEKFIIMCVRIGALLVEYRAESKQVQYPSLVEYLTVPMPIYSL